jgi:hypothetical protein
MLGGPGKFPLVNDLQIAAYIARELRARHPNLFNSGIPQMAVEFLQIQSIDVLISTAGRSIRLLSKTGLTQQHVKHRRQKLKLPPNFRWGVV